jgi:PAS domain S-box-containing protein
MSATSASGQDARNPFRDASSRPLGRAAEIDTRLRLALDAGRMAIWSVDGDCNVEVSPEFNRLLRLPEDHQPTLEELLSRYYPGERERVQELVARAIATGEPFVEWEYRHLWPNDEVRWLLVRAKFLHNRDGSHAGSIGVIMDITDRKRSERNQALLVAELNHRVKNTLAVVQSLAYQSFSRSNDPRGAISAYEGRLNALASAHNLLTRENWKSAEITQIVRQALLPFCADNRCQISGPTARVQSRVAVSLTLAFHELATNATKYGSLSTDEGQVHVSWDVVEDGLEIVWQETGGPLVQEPKTQGFGTRMLRRALASDLGGRVDLRFDPEGLRCLILVHKGQELPSDL